jgi:HTH-type transcriptional regulator/antitoxin MqsA
MKCVFCGGDTKEMSVTFSYEHEDEFLLVTHVPAEICERCGEKTYAPDVADKLIKFAGHKFKPVKKLEVPVFDFSESVKVDAHETLTRD